MNQPGENRNINPGRGVRTGETHLVNQLTQEVSSGSGRAERRVTTASAASRLKSALSGTLTARCCTRMVTALLAGSPPPLIRTRTNLNKTS